MSFYEDLNVFILHNSDLDAHTFIGAALATACRHWLIGNLQDKRSIPTVRLKEGPK